MRDGQRILFDYGKLSSRIMDRYGSLTAFSEALGVSDASLSRKLIGETYFTAGEIEKSISLLALEGGTITSYFFTPARG